MSELILNIFDAFGVKDLGKDFRRPNKCLAGESEKEKRWPSIKERKG